MIKRYTFYHFEIWNYIVDKKHLSLSPLAQLWKRNDRSIWAASFKPQVLPLQEDSRTKFFYLSCSAKLPPMCSIWLENAASSEITYSHMNIFTLLPLQCVPIRSFVANAASSGPS